MLRWQSRMHRSAIAIFISILPASGLAADLPRERLQLCASCHGETGNSTIEKTPSLAGQPALFLTNQLILMRDKLRVSEVMAPFTKDLKDDDIVALSEHYSNLTPEPSGEAVDRALVPRGATLAKSLRCASCHLSDYAGREQMPRLVPQRIDYLIDSLTDYRDGRRSGIDTSMNNAMLGMSDTDIRSLAHYLGSLR